MSSQQQFPFGNQWQLKSLLMFHAAALLLLASWLLPATRPAWQAIDEASFFLLNGSLAEGGSWSYFWALMNVRTSDVVPMLVILLSLTFPLIGIRREQLHRAFIGFVLVLILMWPVRETLYVLAVSLGVSGDSPSLQLQPAYRLSEMFPALGTKDRAGHSFPGDHATVLWTWSGYLFLLLRTRLALMTFVVSMLFMLPRLIAGAHWFTDNFVGGMAVTLIALSWAFFTPLLQRLTDLLCRFLTPFFYRLGNIIPGLSLLPFFRA